MKKLIILGLALGFAVPAFAQQKETSATSPESEQAKQVMALVEKASTLIDSKGKSIFPEFRQGEWRTGDTYLFVLALKGMTLFNGGFPEREGTDVSSQKDSNGKVFFEEFVKVEMMSANRPKADTSPREPVGPVVAYWGTYTVDEAAKTLTEHFERCTWPQWDGHTGTLNLVFPTENELNMTTLKPIPDPKMGPSVPHLNWKRAMAESVK